MSRVEDLFERFRSQGDTGALGRVFDELGPRLQRIARHLAPDRAAAEDLVQATFLTAIEKRDVFDASRTLEPWLTGILIQHASLARRARARVIDPARLDSRASEDPLDVAGAREMSEALTVALSKLKPSDREVLLPLLMDGRRAIEIARELGGRPDTVNMRIHRGLARLRRLLPASFAFALWTGSSHARGLGAVRSEVMRQANVQLGIAGGAGASIAVTTWGVAMTTKQIGLAAAALALSLAVGGYLWVPSLRARSAMSKPTSSAVLEPAPIDRTSNAPGLAASKTPETSSRAEVPLSASREAKKHCELEVLRDDHQPAAGALVAVMDSSHALASTKTDEKGLCRIDSVIGPADVYVRDDGSLPHHTQIDLAAEHRQTIELPSGRELAGRFRMAGRAELPDFELKLSPNTAPEGFAEADIKVFKALEMARYDYKELTARTRVKRDGGFSFRGLPTTWSGIMSLPAELVFVVDGKSTGSSERVFRAPTIGVELEIEYRPRIIGRLIDAGIHAPIAVTRFNAVVEFSNGGSTSFGTESGRDGRFTVPLEERTDAIGFYVDNFRAPDGRTAPKADKVKRTGSGWPFDVGDIQITFPPTRRFEIRVVDIDGKPIPGAHAQNGDHELVVTDEHGIGVFAALPLAATSIRVVASGYAVERVEISKEAVEPREVVLHPTNKLTFALPPEAEGRRGFTLTLVSSKPLFGGPWWTYDWSLRGETIGGCLGGFGNGDEGSVEFRFSADGRIEIEDIHSTNRFRAVLHGSDTGILTPDGEILSEVVIEPLGPGEHRRVDLTLPPQKLEAIHVLHGRALDEQGNPVSDAYISTGAEEGDWIATTELDGRFDLQVANQPTIDVTVAKRGYVPFRARGWSVEETQPIEARLKPGTDLRVELVDTRTRPIAGAALEATIDGFGKPWRVEQGAPGVFTLCDMPDGVVRMTIRVGGRQYERTSDARAGTARITLPDHGRLDVSWNSDQAKDDSKIYQIALRPVGPENVVLTEWLPSSGSVTNHTFESVLPGEYTIGLESASKADGEAAMREYSPLHPPAYITIVGGETRTVELHP